jgi:ATP-dependent Clp protease ATP-binding subunit ClpC
LGHTVSFRNSVIIMTSNCGARELSGDGPLGFGANRSRQPFRDLEAAALSEMRRQFSPEFINRIDEVLVFHPLDETEIRAVLDIQLEALSARLAERGYRLEVKNAARRFLAHKGWDPRYGGRPLRRALASELEAPLSALLLRQSWPPGAVFVASVRNGRLVLTVRPAGTRASSRADSPPVLESIEQGK